MSRKWLILCVVLLTFSSASAQSLVQVLVDQSLYNTLTTEISQYISDLESEGYATKLSVDTWSSPETIRALLQAEQGNGLVGAVLIGQIPLAQFNLPENLHESYRHDFHTSMFYMDLDGEWGGIDQGVYTTHTGQTDAEIWVGLIRAESLTATGTESDILKDYFDRVHDYRNGNHYEPPARAFRLYHTIQPNYQDLERLYSEIDDPGCQTKAADLVSFLNDPNGYQMAVINTASGPNTHHFHQQPCWPLSEEYWTTDHSHGDVDANCPATPIDCPDGDCDVDFEDVQAANPKIWFYHLATSETGRFDRQNNLSGQYVFGTDYGLAALAAGQHTITGDHFYRQLADGLSFGEAYRIDMNEFIAKFNGGANTSTVWCPDWDEGFGAEPLNRIFYAVSVFGDPTLTVPKHVEDPVVVPYTQRVNVGGPEITTSDSRVWSADRGYSTGSFGYVGNNSTAAEASGTITNTDFPEIYQTNRFRLDGYKFDVSNEGSYFVELHFAESFHTEVGKRFFEVKVEGLTKFPSLDLVDVAGKDVAFFYKFKVEVTDGTLDIELKRKLENPMINAIEVVYVPADTTDLVAPTFSGVSAINLSANQATLRGFTDELATSRIEYGPTQSYGQSTSETSTLAAAHMVDLSGLEIEKTYHFRIIAEDENGNQAVSNNASFTTPDDISPGRIDDLSILQIGETSVTLTWTAPGDDGEMGAASSYTLLYGTTPVGSDTANWVASAQSVTDLPAPATAQSTEQYTLAGLAMETRYYFMMLATDNAGNVSPYSNIASDVSLPVELATFQAAVLGNEVVILWRTASESQNAGFSLERRDAPTVRGEEWHEVTFIEGNGTSSTPHEYRFSEKMQHPGIYQYRLRQMDFDGRVTIYDPIQVNVEVPKTLTLEQNYPNPLRQGASSRIAYNLPPRQRSLKTEVRVYNLLGQVVRTLVSEVQASGYYQIAWDGRLQNQNLAPVGIYFLMLEHGGEKLMKKISVVR